MICFVIITPTLINKILNVSYNSYKKKSKKNAIICVPAGPGSPSDCLIKYYFSTD